MEKQVFTLFVHILEQQVMIKSKLIIIEGSVGNISKDIKDIRDKEVNPQFQQNPFINIPHTKPLFTSPLLTNPLLTNPLLTNPLFVNPLVTNPLLTNPLLTNPLLSNPLLVNPMLNIKQNVTLVDLSFK